jgi:hypothetical protein
MPEDANPSQPEAVEASAPTQGLAGVDLLSENTTSRPISKFEEYKADEDEEPRRIEMADEPIRGEIEVVKVKRKKKKEGSKKRVEA